MSAHDLPAIAQFRPWYISLGMKGLNALWRSGRLPPADLCPDRLRGLAEKATGLTKDSIDRDFFEQQLQAYLQSVHTEAKLNDFGRLLAHGALLKVMKERLWFEDILTRHPEIHDIELAPPIIVVGSMRSGTTRIQRLLACDPDFQALRFYESQCPVPSPAAFKAKAQGKRDPRITYVGRALGMLTSINPHIQAIHPTGPLEVDEEIGMLEQSLSSAMIEAQRRVPSFARYCEQHDQTPVYSRLLTLLKMNCWFRGSDPSKPYVLKTPQHMQDILPLIRTFPKSKLIFLHREPAALVGSAASLAWNQMVIQSDEVDAAWVGQEWLYKTKMRLDRAEAAKQHLTSEQKIDINFDDVNKDWKSQISKIYDFLRLELKGCTVNYMESYIKSCELKKIHKSHKYKLENFSLNLDQIYGKF